MNKGFTLVELLAVIVIIALLSTIAVTSAIGISSNIKKEMFCEKVNLIVSDAQRWADSHPSQLSSSCYKTITIKYLIDQGVIKKEENTPTVLNPYTGEEMDGTIGVYIRNNRAYSFYLYSDSEIADDLPKSCGDALPVCTGNSNRDASGKVVCVLRPKACS